jgi:hypothetical protein
MYIFLHVTRLHLHLVPGLDNFHRPYSPSLHTITMAIRSIVVVGAGVIGTSTAYYLSTSKARGEDTTVTLVEATDVASAASGKSGGFLALDWHGQATASACLGTRIAIMSYPSKLTVLW